MWRKKSVIYVRILPIVCCYFQEIIMPYMHGRKGWEECGLVIGEAGIGVSQTNPATYSSETDNALLVDRKCALILHQFFEFRCLQPTISAVLKWQFYIIILLKLSSFIHVFSLSSRGTPFKIVELCKKCMYFSKEDVPTWCKQFYYDFIS